MAVKYAKWSTSIVVDGWPVTIVEGDSWDGDDPVVRQNPDAFADEPTVVRRSRPWEAPVEQATAAPGEKRRTR
jgi:hypothetical protein